MKRTSNITKPSNFVSLKMKIKTRFPVGSPDAAASCVPSVTCLLRLSVLRQNLDVSGGVFVIISSSVLTVLFEEPFWVGIYERRSCGCLQVSKVVFGSEPKDFEIYERFLNDFNSLRFTECFEDFEKAKKVANPKRMREDHKGSDKVYGNWNESTKRFKAST